MDTKLPDSDAIAMIRSEIVAGHCVICSTDTVFGILADARCAEPVATIAKIKLREARNPPPVIVSSLDEALSIANRSYRPQLMRLSEFWPGPLSVVVEVERLVSRAVNPVGGSVALRVPAPRFLGQLTNGLPLAATSANLHSLATEPELDAVVEQLQGGHPPAGLEALGLRLAVDFGVETTRASTIVDLTSETPMVIREGEIPGSKVLSLLS